MIIKPVKKITVPRPVIVEKDISQDINMLNASNEYKVVYYKNWRFYVLNLVLLYSVFMMVTSILGSKGSISNFSLLFFLLSVLLISVLLWLMNDTR